MFLNPGTALGLSLIHILHTERGREEFLPENPPHVQLPIITAVVEHLQGKAVCTCDGISATPTNWVMDRIPVSYTHLVIALNAKQVNKKGYTFAHQVLEDTCNGCASCATVCPDGCITVYKVKQQ